MIISTKKSQVMTTGGSGQNNDKEPPFKKDFKMPNIPSGFGKFGALAYIIIAIIAILAITQPFKVIHSGEVGIKATAGKYRAKSSATRFSLLFAIYPRHHHRRYQS